MHTELVVFLTLLVFSSVLCKPHPYADKCGYDSCHATDPSKLNIHLVPHSHDDVGWLKTVDQYFYGNNIEKHEGVRGVQYILDSVVQSLQENPDRRFIQVETAFFSQWWKQQDNSTKDIVKTLVNKGQLEFIGGGWSMNDEAATNYQSIIDQFTLGLRTLSDLLGECARPKIGWQIDPFGHTDEMANIFTKLGYDAFFFTRLDYRDVKKRLETKNTEFLWKGNPNTAGDIFTSLIYRFYNAPDYFCWDVQCGDTPIVDDKESPEYNVEKRVNEFAAYAEEQAKYYKTNNVLITMGGDFTYQAAEMYYINIDRLIKGFKTFKPNINIIYSTPSCYVKAVNDIANSKKLKFSVNTNDFMPYASDPHSYWTGYYTSRPNSKRFERQGNNLLQVLKQLVTFERAKGNKLEADLTGLKEVMGIMQHHDAITGTEKQHVANDYVRMLTEATTAAEKNVAEIISNLLNKNSKEKPPIVTMQSCLTANISRCHSSTAKRFVVAVYNPLSRSVSHYVRLPVTSVKYKVTEIDGSQVAHQVTPSIDTFEGMQPGLASLYDLVIYAKELPPMGLKYYYVTKEDTDVNKPGLIAPTPNKFTFGTSKAGFRISESTGQLDFVNTQEVGMTVKQEFMYYSSAAGDNATPEKRASGAYIFRPATTAKEAISIGKATITAYTGELVDEVHQKFNSWIKQVIRVYKEENHIEFDWIIGPVEYINKQGVEVISRFTTPFNTTDTFYTDSNGRGLVKRVRNHRQTFTYTNEEPVSGNYYPVTSRIVIRDDKEIQYAVLTDRAQGGSSLNNGEVELMVHRKLTHDDLFGVDEVLDEYEFGKPVVVRGQHYFVMGSKSGSNSEKLTHFLVKAAALQHDVAQRKLLAPWTFVGDASSEDHSQAKLSAKINPKFAGLTKSLPENVHILTLEPWADKSLLLRLEHTFENSEDPNFSKPVTVDLKGILMLYKITSIRETTLGANQAKEANARLKWTAEATGTNRVPETRAVTDEDLKITLNNHEIRTFIIDVELEDKTNICEGDCDDDDDGGASVNNPHVAIVVLLGLIRAFY